MGKTRIDLGANESAAGIALRSDGKIVLGGTMTSGSNSDMLVVRLEGDPGGASGGGKGRRAAAASRPAVSASVPRSSAPRARTG